MLFKIILPLVLSLNFNLSWFENSFNPTIMRQKMRPTPIAKKLPYSFEIHQQKIVDDYHWLRADGWPDKITDQEVLGYLKAENQYFEDFMQPSKKLKDQIFEELKGRIKLADQSVYIKKDNYLYYSRTEEDKDYRIYCRKEESEAAAEEILLDVNKLALGKSFTAISAYSVSPNHKILGYSVDFTGAEKFTIRIMDLENKTYFDDQIPNTIGSIVWHENNSGFFYTPVDENWRHNKLMFHKIGTDYKDDILVFHEADYLYSVNVAKTSDKKFILINVSGHDNNEIYYIGMDDLNFEPHLIKPKKERILYSVDHSHDYFYLHTNEGAKNFKILRAKDDATELNFEEFIAEDAQAYLTSFDLTLNYLLLNYKRNGLAEIVVIDFKSGKNNKVHFPDESYTASGYSTNYELDDIRIDYSSLARPNTVYQYDFSDERLDVLKVQEIPSGFEPAEYTVKRIFAKSEDGALVPVSILYKNDLFKADGSNPLYLYGYGSYGYGMPASFRNTAISLVNRGFVFAIAHIRGGDDLGHDWYEAAKFLTKKRTFNDFIASAEKLVADKYTSKGNIVIVGGSAGGMLIGAVINERPELFKAAIAHVPFVDVLNTMLDETLPLTPGEFKEWGNPKEKEYFDYMRSYSPYDNVKAQNYPHLMVTAGLNDPRVGYWEAAKWVAKLRELKTDSNLIIFKTNMDFGHAGASARFEYLKEAADDLVFILTVF